MPHSSKTSKGSGPSNGSKEFDKDSLSQNISKNDHSLSASHYKRKKPPTNAPSKQQPKRRRSFNEKPSSQTQSSDGTKDRKGDQAALLVEIKALGGDERDLDLINEVDSDLEDFPKDTKHKVDKSLKKELSALSKELGFADMMPDDVIEKNDYEENYSSEGDEETHAREEQPSSQVKLSGSALKPGGLVFEPLAEWYTAHLGDLPAPTSDHIGHHKASVEPLKKHAWLLLDGDADKYKASVFAASSHKFLATIMSSGTLTDKVSALTLAIQESPVHNVRALDALVGLASKKSRTQAIGAIRALVDMLGPGTLLPLNRRLRTFESQPGLLGVLQQHPSSVKKWTPGQPLSGKITGAHLISWAFEDWLKETYFKIIQLLEVWCSDEIEYSRMKAVDFLYGLLKEKPEQEANLLKLLVNKLGDRDRKIASRASHLLLQLQVTHPGMKPIIIRAIEQDVLLHPFQDLRSKYYAINTLNQTILSSKDPSVPETLIRIYFDLFVTLLKAGKIATSAQAESGDAEKSQPKPGTQKCKKKGKPVGSEPLGHGTSKAPAPEKDAADKLVSAILTGVNRAVPFVAANDAIMTYHLDTLFKIAHSTNLNTGVQALLLIQHLSTTRNLTTDRFYRTLYESLLDPRLVTFSKQALYLNLLLRALKNDVDVRRIKAFAKRMLQITGLHQPPFICGILYIISHLRQMFPDLSTLIQEPETSVFDDDEEPNQRVQYDGRKRNPEHSNAHRSCLWEVVSLLRLYKLGIPFSSDALIKVPALVHFHPSVNVLAGAFLDKSQEMPRPDLESHSLIRFLDKFVYKNPKQTDGARGVSIMQPLRAARDAGDIWLGSKSAGVPGSPINSAAFWNKRAEDVAAEDVFFYEYFQHTLKENKKKPPASQPPDQEGEEKDEDEIWEALVSTQPEIAGDESEVGFDDLDDLDPSEDDSSTPFSIESDLDDDDNDDDDSDKQVDSDNLAPIDAADQKGGALDKGRSKTKSRRKALKDLPVFAAVDDYAELLAGEEDGI